MSSAFITGSHAYGKPNRESDIDLVVYMEDYEDVNILRQGKAPEEPVRFGDLNVVICTNYDDYVCWRMGTAMLKKSVEEKGPRDKTVARKLFDKLRGFLGIQDTYAGQQRYDSTAKKYYNDDIPF